MCVICIDFQLGKLTIPEARKNLGELSVTLNPEHVRAVNILIDTFEEMKLDPTDFKNG